MELLKCRELAIDRLGKTVMVWFIFLEDKSSKLSSEKV